jgi:hypothetical protein
LLRLDGKFGGNSGFDRRKHERDAPLHKQGATMKKGLKAGKA